MSLKKWHFKEVNKKTIASAHILSLLLPPDEVSFLTPSSSTTPYLVLQYWLPLPSYMQHNESVKVNSQFSILAPNIIFFFDKNSHKCLRALSAANLPGVPITPPPEGRVTHKPKLA